MTNRRLIRTGISGVSANTLGIYPRDTSKCWGGKRVPLPKGHRLSAAENVSPEVNKKRIETLLRTYKTKALISNGKKVMTVKRKKELTERKRRKLNETVAKELREIAEVARMNATAAMDRLITIVNNPHSRDSDAITAASEIFNRAYGKSTQTNVNANINDNGKETEASARELNTRIDKALSRIETITGGARKAPEGGKGPADVRLSDRDPGSTAIN